MTLSAFSARVWRESFAYRQFHSKMKAPLLWLTVWISTCGAVAVAQTMNDPAHMDIVITPYYNSKEPTIDVGSFSKGMASVSEPELVATITKMKQSWDQLSFPEMYVAAIRLYDLGYRKEAVYWFYSAQYRGRLFTTLIDQAKMGGMGAMGFELLHAHDAFLQLAGPYINGYAFGDIDNLVRIIQRVQKEGWGIPEMKATYPGVKFKDESEWKAANEGLNDGMTRLLTSLKEKGNSIKQQRIENGTEARFSKLTSKEL